MLWLYSKHHFRVKSVHSAWTSTCFSFLLLFFFFFCTLWLHFGFSQTQTQYLKAKCRMWHRNLWLHGNHNYLNFLKDYKWSLLRCKTTDSSADLSSDPLSPFIPDCLFKRLRAEVKRIGVGVLLSSNQLKVTKSVTGDKRRNVARPQQQPLFSFLKKKKTRLWCEGGDGMENKWAQN